MKKIFLLVTGFAVVSLLQAQDTTPGTTPGIWERAKQAVRRSTSDTKPANTARQDIRSDDTEYMPSSRTNVRNDVQSAWEKTKQWARETFGERRTTTPRTGSLTSPVPSQKPADTAPLTGQTTDTSIQR